MNTHEILVAARAKIANPGSWTKGALARTEEGNATVSLSPRAVCWCTYGAIDSVFPEVFSGPNVYGVIDSFMEGDAPSFNDTHTHEEVLAAFDRAIEATK